MFSPLLQSSNVNHYNLAEKVHTQVLHTLPSAINRFRSCKYVRFVRSEIRTYMNDDLNKQNLYSKTIIFDMQI